VGDEAVILLTRAEFVAYLRRNRERTFKVASTFWCPIACSLRAKHSPLGVAVNRSEWAVGSTRYKSPPWAQEFTKNWDARREWSEGTAAEALRLLGEGE
jgi:hypothetical protein